MVFDSTKIATKRKEPPKRKPPRKTLNELNENITFDPSPVPKLDLTCITGEKQVTEYQEGYIPTVINPCNFKFIGECVRTAKNPYKRTRKSKVSVSFSVYFIIGRKHYYNRGPDKEGYSALFPTISLLLLKKTLCCGYI